MTTPREGTLPDHIRRECEQQGIDVMSWKAVHLDQESPDYVALFHLMGVTELLCESKDSLTTCDIVLSNPSAIPLERPTNVKLQPSIWMPSIDPSIRSRFVSLIETWEQVRERMRLQLQRMAFGHALSRFYAAMPNPEGPGIKWSRDLTKRWLEANEHIVPLYDRFKDIRNPQEAHRGKNEDVGGQVSSYHVLTKRYELFRIVNTSHDPGLHFDPTADDVVAFRCLISNALRFVHMEHDTASTRTSYQGT